MTDHDVAVVGGGPAGCSAAVFAARYGLDTVVFDRGTSSLRQCAFIENYLGFPGGIDVETFEAMAQAHAERTGADVRTEMVTDVERTEGGFTVETQDGASPTADRVVAASTYDGSYLVDCHPKFATDRDGETVFDRGHPGSQGRTAVDGLYVAGPLAGVESQIIVSAGHGARVGLAVIEDYRREVEGWWDAAAEHNDWVVEQGRYEGEDWVETITEYHVEDAPDDGDEERVRERARELARSQQDWQIPQEEVERRTERAYDRLLEFVPDERIRARAAELPTEASD
jgi:threonine dehydrogenase-like Zn-dependent dehydrogenase